MSSEQDFRNMCGDMNHSMTIIKEDMLNVTYEHQRPSVIFRPTITRLAGYWRAVYGDTRTGVVAFGISPAEAMLNFDKIWNGIKI